MRVGYLGPEGTVSHDALLAADTECEPVPQPTLTAAVLAVHDGAVDRALVPIENALEGSVNPTLDALVFETEDVTIVGEIRHPVHFCLIAGGPLALDEVRTVVSIPQASGQCARIPSLTSHDTLDPSKIYATAFPCVERNRDCTLNYLCTWSFTT